MSHARKGGRRTEAPGGHAGHIGHSVRINVTRIAGRTAEVCSDGRPKTVFLLTLVSPVLPGDWVVIRAIGKR